MLSQLLKEHWDLILVAFGFGGVVVTHKKHTKDIEQLEDKQDAYQKDITDIKVMLARIDERTSK